MPLLLFLLLLPLKRVNDKPTLLFNSVKNHKESSQNSHRSHQLEQQRDRPLFLLLFRHRLHPLL